MGSSALPHELFTVPNPRCVMSGILNLELSWRGLDGSLRNKLDWAQILADSNGVTLTISDSTLATTGSPCAVEGDAEQGGSSLGPDLLAQMDAYLHIDVFRMDQVIRNMITNAVRPCRSFISHSVIGSLCYSQTKFTPAGGRVQVNISCELQNQENRNKIISKVYCYCYCIACCLVLGGYYH